MKKNIGVWIDHREAIIVTIADDEEETRRLESNVEKDSHGAGGAPSETAEDMRARRLANHLNQYYAEVITHLRGADSILIFGPGEAKGELEKRLEQAGLKRFVVGVSTADKLTDRQIAARVRQRFHR